MRRRLAALALPLACGARTELAAPCDDAATRPAVVLVVDHSASMGALTARGTTWWDELVAALAATLPAREAEVDLGGVVFPVREPRGMSELCGVPARGVVPVGPASAGAIVAALRDAREPWGATPTWSALREARAALGPARPGRPRYVVLLTDGGPNCNEGLDRAACDCFGAPARECLRQAGTTAFCADTRRVVDELRALRDEGVRTVVLGLDVEGPENAGYAEALDAMADAGGLARGGGGHHFVDVGASEGVADAVRRALAEVAPTRACAAGR